MQGSVGILIGFFAFWLVWEFVDLGETRAVVLSTDSVWLVVAFFVYWLSMFARIVRWHRLLAGLSNIGGLQVADALLVGYAMNCLLPARLGEPFRAEYTQRRFGIDRIAVFGSIVTERLLDGLLLVLILMSGLALVSSSPAPGDLAHFELVASVGLAIFAFVAIFLVVVRKAPLLILDRPGRLNQILRRFMNGAAGLGRQDLVSVVFWTILVWMLELIAIWVLLVALGTVVAFHQMLVLVGAGALSTIVPTAPGYLGTLQLVFAAVMTLFALPPAAGVAAATLVQVVFYGSLIIVGDFHSVAELAAKSAPPILTRSIAPKRISLNIKLKTAIQYALFLPCRCKLA